MDIAKAFEVAFNRKVEKNWEKIYVVVDIHDTILRACYENEETYDYYPYSREALQLLKKYEGQTMVLDMESPYQDPCPNPEQRRRRHGFYLRNGFRDTDVYRSYGDITMTVMMTGPGTFTLQDWDDITNELKQFWWIDD